MKLISIHHVAIICSDYARSKDFYINVLGLSQVAENWREDRQSMKLDLRLPGGGQLEIFSFPSPPPRPSRPEAQGLRHLAFSTHDLALWHTHLSNEGYAPEPIRIDEYTGQAFFFLKDPDDLPIEFYEVPA